MIVISEKVNYIRGNVHMLKDSFMSHTALVLASQVVGITRIYDIAFNDDIAQTIKSLKLLGIKIKYNRNHNICTVQGVGVGGFLCAKDALYLSEPSIYMIMGCLSNCPFSSFLCGCSDLDISKIVKPLVLMGARFVSNGDKLPVALVGCIDMLPINYTAEEEEVRAALLFAAINTCGVTTIIDPIGRDRIAPMLQYFNVSMEYSIDKKQISISGQQELYSKDVCIPNDFFFMLSFITTALILKDSEIIILNVLLNNKMRNFYKILMRMGGNIFFINKRKNIIGEEIVDLLVRSSILHGVDYSVNEDFDIDEYLVMLIISACASGITVLGGILNIEFIAQKLNIVINELIKCGVNIESKGNDLIIYGCSGNILGGNLVNAYYDLKIAILFIIIGMISNNCIRIKNIRKTSDFISIVKLFNKHGAKVRVM